MKKLLIYGIATLALVFGLAFMLQAPDVSANALDEACASDPGSVLCDDGEGGSVQAIIAVIVNTLLFIVGIISVIMIIVGGIRYTVSAGDGNAVAAAKATILYAVIGLVVAFASYAIINWVLRLF
jgi:hypothetical protein